LKGVVGIVMSRRPSGASASRMIATHNLELARRLDRIVALEDGRLKDVK
jgi:predicted ABC-type transport system involved in lysophospholipase L1 biosynthesis ATPase subunit